MPVSIEKVDGWRGRVHRQRGVLIPVFLLLTVAMVFFSVCGADFVNYDDTIHVYENDRITSFSMANFLYFWKGPHQGLYIPLTYSLWGLVAKVSSFLPASNGQLLHPSLFHAVNLFLHGVAVVVIFQILRLMLKHDWAAGAGALLFAVHPVQVEAVAWVTGMRDVLSGLFSLLALWQYLSYASGARVGCLRRKCYGLAGLFFLAALLSKPGAVTIPLVAAALGYFIMKRTARQLALELGPWVVLALPVAFAAKLFQPDAQYTFVPAFWERFLIAGDALSFYLGKLVLPWTLAPDYGRTPQYVLAQAWVYGSGLLSYLLFGLLLWKYRKPWALAATAAFVAVLLPVLGLTPFHFQDISTVADRYLYVAMLGPALALGWGLTQYQQLRWGWIVTGVLLVALGIKSAAQVRYWQDSLTFNNYAVKVNPQSATAYINLGVAFRDAKQIDLAIAAYQKAIAIDPRNLQPYLNLGNRYKDAKRPQEAISYFKKAVEVDPADADAYFKLGDIYRESGDSREALSYYKLGLGLRPDFARGHANLGLLYKSMNNDAEAIAAYLKAIEVKPDFAEVYNNLGLIYEKDNKEEAISMYQKALAMKPDLGEAANNLGILYLGLKRDREAIPLFQKAMAVYPDNPLPCNNLGLAYFNLGQFSEATGWFQKAITIKPSFAPALNNLSRVDLQLGKIDSALDYADKAKALGFSDPEHFEALQRYRR